MKKLQTHIRIDRKSWLKNRKSLRGAQIVAVVAVVAIISVFALTRAAGTTAQFEAENGTPSVSQLIINDATASGGKAIKFGSAQTQPPTSGRTYPWHTNITSTTFWVGENFRAASDGSQVCSTYDSEWAKRWAPAEDTTTYKLGSGTDCAGAPIGGCDGKRGTVTSTKVTCTTETRTAANNYFPSWTTTAKMPRENPFYLDLPYDDINDNLGFKERCTRIPWANDPGYAGKCNDSNFSYMKNRWVEIKGPNGNTCYGQIEDAGPADEGDYSDWAYVFGSNDERPINSAWESAGADVSPALNGCLGYSDIDGSGDKISWRFIEAQNVPAGPWKVVVTTSQVN